VTFFPFCCIMERTLALALCCTALYDTLTSSTAVQWADFSPVLYCTVLYCYHTIPYWSALYVPLLPVQWGNFEPLHKLQAHDTYILKCLLSPEFCESSQVHRAKYSAVQCSAVQCSTVQYSTVHYSTGLLGGTVTCMRYKPHVHR